MTSEHRYLTADDLANVGLTPADVRRLCPWAVEYAGLGDELCWLAADLVTLLEGEGDPS